MRRMFIMKIDFNAFKFSKNKKTGEIIIEYNGYGLPTSRLESVEQFSSDKVFEKCFAFRKKQLSSGNTSRLFIKNERKTFEIKIMANIVKTFFMLIRGKFLIILTFRFFFFN